jgi:DNA-binding NarL/FixJ family response regulator
MLCFMRVLVVDDSMLVRQRLRSWLSDTARVELGEAVAPCEVLERLGAIATDLVLLDLHFGGTATGCSAVGCSAALGLELIERIKGALPRALVVVLSNAASEAHRRECLRRGADYFFDKSLEFERAIQLVASRAAATG